MTSFRAGRIDILIATTVIEVGIDVPNATVILIDQADRFGLAQLHQLRGRVGRGSEESHCILLSDARGTGAEPRLTAITQIQSGFEIAEMDLKLRGPGEFALRLSANLAKRWDWRKSGKTFSHKYKSDSHG